MKQALHETLIPGHLRAAVVSQRIYPPGSPIVERSVQQTLQLLEQSLESGDALTFTCRQGHIYLRGKDLPEAAPLAPLLEEHGIQSLTFQPGVTAPEIAQLVILLSRKKLPDGKVVEWLRAQQVARIQVDKVTMVEVMEGEVVMKRVDQLMDGVKDFPGMLGSLRDAYEMMDKMPDEKSRAGVQEHLARKMAGLEPSLLRDMFENELPKKVEDSGLRTMVLNAMTQDKIHDIFSQIGDWYRTLREQTGSDLDAVEQLNKLKTFLGKILNAPASKKIPFALYEELLNKGLLDQIPSDIRKGEEDESPARQVDQILEKPSPALLEQPVRDQLPALLKKLLDVGLDDLSEKLLKKLLENFSQGTPVLRQMAARVSRQLLEVLALERKESLWNVLSAAVEQLAETERSPDAYKEAAETVASLSVQLVLRQRLAEAAARLAMLRRHRHEANPLAPKRPDLAAQALKLAAEGAMDALLESLLSQDKRREEEAQAVLVQLGEAAVPAYLRLIKKSESVRLRRLAANALKYVGAEARARLAAEFHVGNTTETLLNVLSVLDDFLSPDLVSRFESFLHYPDATIRRRLIQLLLKMSDPSAPALLAKFLDDPDESVQIEAVRAAGETKSAEAVPKLVDLLKGGSTRRLEETCLALGQTADGRAVAALSELIEPKTGLFKKRPAVEETVRVRAAWALSQIRTAEARQALSRCLKDPNLQIQTIARHALDDQNI